MIIGSKRDTHTFDNQIFSTLNSGSNSTKEKIPREETDTIPKTTCGLETEMVSLKFSLLYSEATGELLQISRERYHGDYHSTSI